MVEEIEFAESKNAGAADQTGRRHDPGKSGDDGFMSLPEGEDLPFN